MSKKTQTLEDRLADIADEAEAGEEDQTVRPIPAHVKVTRGNVRSKVLQVRLNPDEYSAIERVAERRGLPASTVAREALLKLVAEEDAQDKPLVTLVALADRIKAAAVDVAVACEDHPTTFADSKFDHSDSQQRAALVEHLMSRFNEQSDDQIRAFRETFEAFRGRLELNLDKVFLETFAHYFDEKSTRS